MKIIKTVVTIASLVVCIVSFCIVAVSGKIYSLADLPLNFMSAFLGAIITASITLLLLHSQSSAKEIKEKNVKVFEKKSQLYENYIEKLYQIIAKWPINIEDFQDVRSGFYSKIVLYLDIKFHKDITDCFQGLADCVETSIDDYLEKDKDKTEDIDKLRLNLTKIINILSKDLGLSGGIDIDLLTDTEKKVFLQLFRSTLLQEVINCFSKEKDIIIIKTCYCRKEKGDAYIELLLQGKNSNAGNILIGPFVNRGMKDFYLASERLHFRLEAPQFNHVADLYTLKFDNDNKNNFISLENKEMQNECDEIGYIDLSLFLDNSAFEDNELDRNMYNDFIPPFDPDDSEYLYSRYHGIYLDVCKAIAKRAYHYFRKAHAVSRQEGQPMLPIRELCIKMGEVTNAEKTAYETEQQGMSLEDDHNQ